MSVSQSAGPTDSPTAALPASRASRDQAAASVLADAATAARAVALALPMIDAAMQLAEIGESGFLYIVVMDPGVGPGDGSPTDAILHEHAIGDRAQWDADYAAFARAKAFLSWRTGLDSHVVQTRYPHLLRAGETSLWGSVCLDGICVGVSGANPWYDEAFAGAVACNLRALVKGGLHTRKPPLFLG